MNFCTVIGSSIRGLKSEYARLSTPIGLVPILIVAAMLGRAAMAEFTF
jgi:hypothetical protein